MGLNLKKFIKTSMFIGITGTARTGKDKFADLMIEFLQGKYLTAKKYALADELKEDLFDLVKGRFGWDIFGLLPEQKEIVRPLMVAYGCGQRKISNGTHWTNALDSYLSGEEDFGIDTSIISDIRFAEYPKDELWWLQKKHNGKLIHLTRLEHGAPIGPANAEENMNNYKLKAAADYTLTWDTDESKCRDFVFNFMEEHPELWKL